YTLALQGRWRTHNPLVANVLFRWPAHSCVKLAIAVSRVAGAAMDAENLRLSRLSTPWSLVCLAHHGPADAGNAARQELLERYGGAVRRYLGKALPNQDAADEIFQDFTLHLLRGDLRGANPERGRFRNFEKGTLFHLIADYRKQQQRWPGPLPE